MIYPIYEKRTVLYGNKGKYTLLKKDGNEVTYLFEPWGENNHVIDRQICKADMKKLSDILHVRLIWAVWEE